MRVHLDSGYKSTLQAVKCCGSVSCHCLLPCGSQRRCENNGGTGGLGNTGGTSRLPEHGRMVRWIQLSCKIKGRKMWFSMPVLPLTSCTTLSGHLTFPNCTFFFCWMLIIMLPFAGDGGIVRLNKIMFAELLAQCLAYSKCSINDISYNIYCN